jgi:hypothetical protein
VLRYLLQVDSLFANVEVILGNNGGAGGTRDVGCLRYNFAATLDKTQL